MPFDSLLGNEQLKENLRRSLKSGHISHFYLISGAPGSGRHTLAKLLAAAILCADGEKPCLKCNPCRKVMENNHPDFITVDDPEHKNVAVKIVRQMREDVFIRPNESDYKIYFLPQELGIEGQNALLKILEEPPSYGVFILLTDNPERLLPTVRSRCTHLQLRPLESGVLMDHLKKQYPQASREDLQAAAMRAAGFLGQAKAFLEEENAMPPQTAAFAAAFEEKDALALTKALVPLEKWKRDQLVPLLEGWVQLLQQSLCYRSGIPAAVSAARQIGTRRSPKELLAAITALQTAIDYLKSNVSPAAVCGWLVWELR
jgi:DNA polymerase-3 subunit delta'